MTATYTPEDNQCMLNRTHTQDHKLPSKNTDHKCRGTLDCAWCSGYWLKEFDRCQYKKITIQIWVELEEDKE